MLDNVRTVVYFESDLREISKDKTILDIDFKDFKIDRNDIHIDELRIFQMAGNIINGFLALDDDSKTKLLIIGSELPIKMKSDMIDQINMDGISVKMRDALKRL